MTSRETRAVHGSCAALDGHPRPAKAGSPRPEPTAPSRAPRRARQIVNTKKPPRNKTRSLRGRRWDRVARALSAGAHRGGGSRGAAGPPRRPGPDLPQSVPELATPPAPAPFSPLDVDVGPARGREGGAGRQEEGAGRGAQGSHSHKPQASPRLPGRNRSRTAPARHAPPLPRALPPPLAGGGPGGGEGGGGTIT